MVPYYFSAVAIYGLFMGSAFAVPMVNHRGLADTHRPIIPQFVIDHVPILYLHKNEKHCPSRLEDHFANVVPKIDYEEIKPSFVPALDNLADLNKFGKGGSNVYLTSKVKVTGDNKKQDWLKGVKPVDGKSAPIVLIVADKGNGTVDAFFITFWSYNQGTQVFGVGYEWGNHVGDWEHVMIRFINGEPKYVWMGQHSKGQAFTFEALEKDTQDKKRMVAYVAINSHAIYSTTGTHDHTFSTEKNNAFGPLQDYTNKGQRWDLLATPPLSYFYNMTTATYTASAENPGLPTAWLGYQGRWGDKQYSQKDTKSQHKDIISGESVYVDGPSGPRNKGINRTGVCPDGKECKIYNEVKI